MVVKQYRPSLIICDDIDVSISELRFLSLVACLTLLVDWQAVSFNLRIEILIIGSRVPLIWTWTQGLRFNLRIEILIIGRKESLDCNYEWALVSISELRFLSLVVHET